MPFIEQETWATVQKKKFLPQAAHFCRTIRKVKVLFTLEARDKAWLPLQQVQPRMGNKLDRY